MDADPAIAWSPDRVELLRLHHAMGLSAAMSADLIGDVSRNAVISKRRRLGLFGANPLQAMLRAVRSAARPRVASPATGRPGGAYVDVAPEPRGEPLPFMDWPPPPRARPRPLAEREAGECAWPLGPAEAAGDYRTLFCCAPVGRAQTYCPHHRALAVAAPPFLDGLAPVRPRACRARRGA